VDNIKMDLREIGWDGMNWVGRAAQDKDQWRVLVNSIEPSSSMKCWEVLEWLLKKGSAS
jgi:hypothetical protein